VLLDFIVVTVCGGRGLQILKLFIIQISPLSCYFHPFWIEIFFSAAPCSQTPSVSVLYLKIEAKLIPHIKI
jgi:hypothetical protein